MSFEVRAAAATDAGAVRDNNEDSYFVGSRVFCVADGLGGHQAGEVASELASQAVRELDSLSLPEAVSALESKAKEANDRVVAEATADSAKAGMGTTLTAVVIDDSTAHFAHVGDSRAYLIRDDDARLITEDHTVVGRMVADGMMTAEQAADHPQRSILTRALGTDRNVDVDLTHVELRGGDRLLLCSDGLTAVFSGGELGRYAGAVAGDDLDAIVAHFVEETNSRGEPDNVTVVLIEVEGTPSGGLSKQQLRRKQSVRRVSRRAAAWTIVLALSLSAIVVGVRSWVGGSYFVGVQNDRVAIFHGVPISIPLLTYQEIEEATDIPSERVQPFQLAELEQGILVGSLEEARSVVEERIRPNLKPQEPTEVGEPPS